MLFRVTMVIPLLIFALGCAENQTIVDDDSGPPNTQPDTKEPGNNATADNEPEALSLEKVEPFRPGQMPAGFDEIIDGSSSSILKFYSRKEFTGRLVSVQQVTAENDPGSKGEGPVLRFVIQMENEKLLMIDNFATHRFAMKWVAKWIKKKDLDLPKDIWILRKSITID